LHTGKDRRMGTDRRPAAHPRTHELVPATHEGSRILHVGEAGPRPDEDVVFECDPFEHTDVILNATAVADHNSGSNEDRMPQDAARSDAGAGHNVAKVPDLRVSTDEHAFSKDGAGVDLRRRHGFRGAPSAAPWARRGSRFERRDRSFLLPPERSGSASWHARWSG